MWFRVFILWLGHVDFYLDKFHVLPIELARQVFRLPKSLLHWSIQDHYIRECLIYQLRPHNPFPLSALVWRLLQVSRYYQLGLEMLKVVHGYFITQYLRASQCIFLLPSSVFTLLSSSNHCMFTSWWPELFTQDDVLSHG